VLLLGSDAVAIGAVRAGCRFYVAYPMTPSTGALHFIAVHERDLGMIVVQPENEIAAINMVAGLLRWSEGDDGYVGRAASP